MKVVILQNKIALGRHTSYLARAYICKPKPCLKTTATAITVLTKRVTSERCGCATPTLTRVTTCALITIITCHALKIWPRARAYTWVTPLEQKKKKRKVKFVISRSFFSKSCGLFWVSTEHIFLRYCNQWTLAFCGNSTLCYQLVLYQKHTGSSTFNPVSFFSYLTIRQKHQTSSVPRNTNFITAQNPAFTRHVSLLHSSHERHVYAVPAHVQLKQLSFLVQATPSLQDEVSLFVQAILMVFWQSCSWG